MTDKEELKNQFLTEIEWYQPDWKKIAKRYETDPKAVEHFCKALKGIKESRGVSLRDMGEKLSYSGEYVSKIIKGKIKKIPLDKLDIIFDCYGVSPAYMIGLINEEEKIPDETEAYFWEYPDSEYLPVKDEVVHKAYINPMISHGAPINHIANEVFPKLLKEYDLMLSLQRILRSNSKNKKLIIELIRMLEKFC